MDFDLHCHILNIRHFLAFPSFFSVEITVYVISFFFSMTICKHFVTAIANRASMIKWSNVRVN